MSQYNNYSPTPSPSDVGNCVVSDWMNIGQCDKECGGGLQHRYRTIITEPTRIGKSCPTLNGSVPCNTQPCSQNCIVSEWTNGVCDKECGGGQLTRTRAIIKQQMGDGESCPTLTETIDCNTQACIVMSPPSSYTEKDVDCVMGDDWIIGECSKECGGGTRQRRNNILVTRQGKGEDCLGSVIIDEKCNTQPCESIPSSIPSSIPESKPEDKSFTDKYMWYILGVSIALLISVGLYVKREFIKNLYTSKFISTGNNL